MEKREKVNKIFKSGMAALLLLFVFTMVNPIEVQAAPKISKKSVTLLKGKGCTLKITGTKNKVTWKTNKKVIAKLTGKKKTSVNVKAMRAGNATISAKIDGKTYKCKVKVVDPNLNNSKLTMAIGSDSVLKVRGGTGKIKWESSNKNVVEVNGGKLTAKQQGTAKVTAVQNKRKMICTITVTDTREDGKKLVEKKIWVVTERAVERITPIYEKIPIIQCVTCSSEFEDVNEWGVHAENHMDNGEAAQSTVYARKTLLGYETTYTEEQGYWKTVQVWE